MNELYVATWKGDVLDTIRPPSVRRRGVPGNAHVEFDTDESLSFRDRVEMLSLLHSIYRMLDGNRCWSATTRRSGGEPPSFEFLADIYVTVLSSDRQVACVDGSVPYANETRARITVSRRCSCWIGR